MLIALFVVFFLVGGSDGSPTFMSFIADSKDSIKAVIVDDERQKKALGVLDRMDKRTKALNKQVKKSFKELDGLIEDQSDTSTELTVLLDQHLSNTEAYSSDILDLRFELKDHIPREEWSQIFSE